MEALDNRSHDPAGVGQDECQEQVGMDLITKTSHLPINYIISKEKHGRHQIFYSEKNRLIQS